MNENSQEKYIELQLLSQQIQKLQEQIQILEQQLLELGNVDEGLDEISKSEKDGDILTPLGAGIFLKTKLVDEKNIILNVGSDICVTKKISDAKQLVKEFKWKERQKLELIFGGRKHEIRIKDWEKKSNR